MKKIIVFLLVATLTSCMTKSLTLSVPAKKTAELEYPAYQLYTLAAKNTSLENLVIKDVDFSQNDSITIDTLGAKSKKELVMNESKKLFFNNHSDSTITVQLKLKNKKDTSSKPIVLKNKSNEMIPLFYTNGTYLNIGPNSNATFWFRDGLRLYFTEKGERFLLFVINEKLVEEGKIDVVEALKKRKKELAL